MAPSTLPPEDGPRYAFESQVREAFGRVAYSHKTHEKMAERYSRNLRWVKIWQIVLSALTAGGAVTVLFKKDSPWIPFATATLAIGTVILSTYVKDLDPGAAAQKHRETASDLWNVREAYLSLLADIRDSKFDLDHLRQMRDALQERLYKIYRPAPHTDAKAYGEAQDALKSKEDLTFSDAEIDAFLPNPLKRARAVS